MSKAILVTGATGQQGGATVDALLASASGWKVIALSRKPEAPAARALVARGVQVLRGDMTDRASLREAMRGVHGVYSVQANSTTGVDVEIRQGKLVADVAAECGVTHFVYSSVGGAERRSGVPHFESKWAIEEHIRQLGLAATILRPATFMDNLAKGPMRAIMLSMMKTFVPDTTPLQLIAVRDIGAFVALAFDRPQEFAGQAIELAGDTLTRPQIIAALKSAGLSPAISLRFPTALTRRMPEDFPLMFKWFAEHGYRADIPTLRARRPELLALAAWAKSRAGHSRGQRSDRT
jgi:uncharacterized protein YbjT (DUF2867 family)